MRCRWPQFVLEFLDSARCELSSDAVKHDVGNQAEAQVAVETAVKHFDRLDVVVNNAGYGIFAPFEQLADEDFKGIVDACFYGVVYTTRAALPVMRKQKSGILFQSSRT